MTITVNGSPLTIDMDSLLIWDVVIGILGALFGGIVLAGIFHISVGIAGHPIISAMIMAFIGAVILLVIFRLFAGRGYRRRAF